MQSIVSYRLLSTKDTLGAMNLYSRSVDAFGDDDIENGGAVAAHVAVALADAQNVAHLETVISVRTDIGRAEGILMERFDLTSAQAFAVCGACHRIATSSSTAWQRSSYGPGRHRADTSGGDRAP